MLIDPDPDNDRPDVVVGFSVGVTEFTAVVLADG